MSTDLARAAAEFIRTAKVDFSRFGVHIIDPTAAPLRYAALRRAGVNFAAGAPAGVAVRVVRLSSFLHVWPPAEREAHARDDGDVMIAELNGDASIGYALLIGSDRGRSARIAVARVPAAAERAAAWTAAQA